MAEAEGGSAQNLAVEPPGDNAGAIEFQQLFGLKASGMADLKELVLGIAAAMPQYFVQRAEKFGAIGDQDDGAAAFFQRIPDVAQGLVVVGEMLDDIETDYGIE